MALTKVRTYWTTQLVDEKKQKSPSKESERMINAARSILDIDIYASQGIRKYFNVTTIEGLYKEFKQNHHDKSFDHKLSTALYSQSKAERVVNLFTNLYRREMDGQWPAEENIRRVSVMHGDENKDQEMKLANTDEEILQNLLDPGNDRIITQEVLFQCQNEYIHDCKLHRVNPCSVYMSNMYEPAINLCHYGLTDAELKPIITNLFKNFSTSVFLLSDNQLTSIGACYIEELLKNDNSRILLIDLSTNQLGADGMKHISEGLKVNQILQKLSLRDNLIGTKGCEALSEMLPINRSLIELDISYNALDDNAMVALSIGLLECVHLSILNLSHNSIKDKGGVELFYSLGHNRTITTLDVSNNMLNTMSGISFGECLATNSMLQKVDLSHNEITYEATPIIAEGIRWNMAVQLILLNHNPIGKEGGKLLRSVVDKKPYITTLGLENIDFEEYFNKGNVKQLTLDGHYRLRLDRNWDHALASLLKTQKFIGRAKWEYVTLDGCPINITDRWNLPRSGILDLTFTNAAKLRERGELSDPVTHFDLNLSFPDHHHMALLLIQRGMINPSETWQKCTLNGEIFDISEDPMCAYSYIETMMKGILSMDYITDTLPCNPHYTLDLKNTEERIRATQLLDRIYSFQFSVADKWCNITLDNIPLTLKGWEQQFENNDRRKTAETTSQGWRLPKSGILSFDYFTNEPHFLCCQHFRYDLTNFQEHDIACELYKRAIKVPGENIWNIKINGIHFDPLLDLDYNGKFVKFGTIDFEYIITKNKFDMELLYREHFEFDLSNDWEYENCLILYERCYNTKFEEYVINIIYDNQEIQAPFIKGIKMPKTKKIEFDYCFCMKGKPISLQRFKTVFQDLMSSKGDKSRLATLTMLCTTFYFTCAMSKQIMELFAVKHRKAALKVLCNRIIDVHNGLLLYELFDFDNDLQEVWKNWLFTGMWDDLFY